MRQLEHPYEYLNKSHKYARGHITVLKTVQTGKEDVPESRIHAPEMPLMYQNEYGVCHAYRWTFPEQGRSGYNANSDPQ